ncbi:hypothetical protein [Kitasatospora sp. NPDC051914]|uniref:hypothetical protein n=1 Tax=Kitasatospora sp. NPDC051914 TaxID=3154945 RepID=UPI00342EDC17
MGAAVAVALLTAGCGSGASSGSSDSAVLSAGTASPESASALSEDSASASPSASPDEESTTPSPEESEEPEESSPEAEEESATPEADDGSTGADTAAEGPSGTYDVTITGVAGGRSFNRAGTLRILGTISESGTTNGVNPVDVCLVSGSPAARPEAGAIWFGSNSGCNPGAGAARLDLAYVTAYGSTVTVEPDQRIAATLGNHYTVSSGLAACPFAPVSGSMRVTASGGRLTGRMDIMGYGGAFCGQTRYQADLTGSAR